MNNKTMESRVNELLARMTLEEKIGQMTQISGAGEEREELIRQGQVGSFLNVVDVETYNRYQRIAMEESRLGIPLIMGRDVIHGFRTVFPIPLGQSAAWHPELVERAAAIAAREASSLGVNWTFAPMVDVARDPRWGRIAEGGGEDPYLTSQLGRAMVRGFQGEDLSAPDRIAACAKHYVGYGAAEGGRDYNTTLIPEGVLRDVYLPPFKACVEAGAATVMSAFNEINGIPATGNAFTLRQILKGEWSFDGFVVSDWQSVIEMVVHGFCADEKDAARVAVTAGVDMEMVSQSYRQHLAALVAEGKVPLELIDEAVRRILRIKMRLGLFENPYVDPARQSVLLAPEHLEVARQLARESVVLLKNEEGVLPLSGDVRAIAVIGPLADAPADQLGCWVFDGRPEDTITPLRALRERLKGKADVLFAPGLESPRSDSRKGFDEALEAARKADVVLLFVGEDAILSGEAHCRAFLDLPGAQEALIEAVAAEGKPTIAVVMTGRPLTLSRVVDKVHALLIAWHPGTMGGPAIADLLFGDESPSGKLPVTFPRAVGQIPIYYAHKNTGRPPQQIDREIPLGTPLDPIGFFSSYLDVEPTPLFPFGYGLSYTRFQYENLRLSRERIRLGESLVASVDVQNVGPVAAEEIVQLYVRDLVGSVTRPVKELKGFQRVRLEPGERRTIQFTLHTDDLRFHDRDMEFVTEPGQFHLWIGGSSVDGPRASFEIVE
ncbi:MAG TPA: beta-glucosidase BglX [Caldilineae bacterium]|nr:beta-glucosidase BglX [Caldilineae bacterium]